MNAQNSTKSGDIFLFWPSKSKAPSLKRIVRTPGDPNAPPAKDCYTMIVLDKDSPYPEKAVNSPLALYMRINIGYNGTRGNELIPYDVISTDDEIAHRIVAIAFIQQKGWIDPDNLNVDIRPEKFPLEKFVKAWGLKNYLQCCKLTN